MDLLCKKCEQKAYWRVWDLVADKKFGICREHLVESITDSPVLDLVRVRVEEKEEYPELVHKC